MSFAGKKNIYLCDGCGEQIVTVDREAGVTPFMVRCKVTPGCRDHMYSKVYRVDQTLEPNYEWYKPTSSLGLDAFVKEHVDRGGLLLRKIQ